MSDECIFCKIIDGEVPCHKVYEDENVIAFLDAEPVSEGHTLVVPKKHVENIHEAKGMSYIWDSLVKVSNAVKNGLNAEGVKLVQNNGEMADQSVFHLHFHITPVYDGTEMEVNTKRSEVEDGERISNQIKQSINSD